jgi:iron(II)-dependent oxidoreductase
MPLVDWYRRNRARSAALFDLLDDGAYYVRPIALRQPVVFYEGHLPAFSFNTLVKRGLGHPSIDAHLESLFARGIDPEETAASAQASSNALWPTREQVKAFAAKADEQVLEALAHENIDEPGDPLLHRSEAALCILEHEAMHQETLLYMWHQIPYSQKRRPPGYRPRVEGSSPPHAWVEVPGGVATLGVEAMSEPFTWDNERPASVEQVPAFEIERHNVTNEQFMAFVDAGGYADERWWQPKDWEWIRAAGISHPMFWTYQHEQWFWRGMFELVPLPAAWPVYVSHAEARAYARWKGCRLPTEAEFQRAAYGTRNGHGQRYPWGDAPPAARHGVFDFSCWEPEPAGTHPEGASAWGIEDLVGNGWEWTSTVFGPFPGFEPMPSYPEYSADFFDGEHFVMKGASPATARELLRPSFRNWFRPRYPYVYATFRCVADDTDSRRA